jgi:hypothetical protein
MRFLFALAWYALYVAGTWHVYKLGIKAKREGASLGTARRAATALGLAGVAIWGVLMLEQVQSKVGRNWLAFDVLGLLDILGTGILWGIFQLAPMWLPRWLLTGEAGAWRRGAAVVISTGIAIFCIGGLIVSPFLLLWGNSMMEIIGGILTVWIPLLVIVNIARITAKLAGAARTPDEQTEFSRHSR